MAAMNEQRELANEIANSLADPVNAGMDVDEVSMRILSQSIIRLDLLLTLFSTFFYDRRIS